MVKQVLIVDDDPSIRLVLEHALAGEGYEVTAVDDGAEVAELLHHRAFDLVVLDLYMPGVNGFEVLRRIRAPRDGLLPERCTTNTVKVLVISAHSDPATTAFVRKRGADACLAKPFELSDLLQVTHRLLTSAEPVESGFGTTGKHR